MVHKHRGITRYVLQLCCYPPGEWPILYYEIIRHQTEKSLSVFPAMPLSRHGEQEKCSWAKVVMSQLLCTRWSGLPGPKRNTSFVFSSNLLVPFFVQSRCVPLRVKAQIPGPCPDLCFCMCALQLLPKRKGGTTFRAFCTEADLYRPE